MCGITGVYALNDDGLKHLQYLEEATDRLQKRGPDARGLYFDRHLGLGHRRLSIIDTSEAANQPMQDATGNYTIVYNGEIYNFRELGKMLQDKGVIFKTRSDTEVLLYMFIHYGVECLDKLNGFFSFAVYDKQQNRLTLVRDRFGIKPLLYARLPEALLFASEMKALLSYPLPRQLNYSSLYTYLQLNYIPAPSTIFNCVSKLLPGHYLEISPDGFKIQQWYEIQKHVNPEETPDISHASGQFLELLEQSVQARLIADVPLGAFLSGGLDSSAIVALASRHTRHLNTFSIGFRDEPFFDETAYANLVASHFKTNHTVFSLTTSDLYGCLDEVLDYIDEPFADSSALAVYILSKQTRQKVTVTLSGDGADELLGGYNKHRAEYRARNWKVVNPFVRLLKPVFEALPKSRNTPAGNFIRQLHRYAEGLRLDPRQRYWRWCAYAGEDEAAGLLNDEIIENHVVKSVFQKVKKNITGIIRPGEDLNSMLLADMHLVLPNDMLMKVDSMSMANSLEVRVPFLDHRLVEYVFSLPSTLKIGSRKGKLLLRNAFKDILPAELFDRPKHGFEVPLLKWFRNELRDRIENEWLSEELIRAQGIFRYSAIDRLKTQLFSKNPGEVQARIWGLIVFQHWYLNNFR